MLIFLVVLVGLCLGSFFNALVYRIGYNESITRGRSKCPKCEKNIAWYDLVPVLSFLWLHGKCRNCRQTISLHYPLVELITTMVLVLFYSLFGLTGQFWVASITTLFLIPIFLIDLKFQIIPDRLIIPGIITILLTRLVVGVNIGNLLMAMLIGAGFFAWQYVLSRGRWIGAGEIGLGALMGAALGWPQILIALALAYISGAVVGIVLVTAKKQSITRRLPFAPFLTTATVITLVCGSLIQQWFNN